MKCVALFVALLAALLSSCSDDSSSSRAGVVSARTSEIPGYILLKATGKTVVVGTKDSTAKENERPQMRVMFDYDFSLGQSEVTCGEFNKIMGKADLPEGMITKVACDEDDLPATNVSYYDIILFANAKSIADGFDTAYSYQSVTIDGEGHCSGLTGLTLRNTVDAFRLPTEAEWMAAARIRWKPDSSWNSENSDYRPHSVCHFVSDSVHFCDMEGNVKEFVYDWLGKFSDTTVANFMGSPQADGLGQRVLKGGSFKHSKEYANAYRRGDDYVVTSATHADYVGFRLAYGAIPDPAWMNGGSGSSSNTVSLVSSTEMKKRFGTMQVKVAFRNHITGNLEFIDYSLGSKVFEIEDDVSVFHPDISPDGKWVAFCTGIESVDGKSEIYVRTLSPISSDLVKLNVERAAIPRWRVTSGGDTVIVYATNAGDNSDKNLFMGRSTWQVPFSNGKFGKPQKLFDGAFHGGVSRDDRLAVTGSRLLRSRTESDEGVVDSVWYNGEQACNVSLSKDDSKRTLFLDFGRKTDKENNIEGYGVHERIQVMDSTGKLIQYVSAPDDYAFDHSEWTFGNNAIVSLTNYNGVHEKIALVDMSTDSVLALARGEELWHPAMWVDGVDDFQDSGLDMDSAGVYLKENDSWASVIMRYKMELLWRYADSANVAILGSSRPLYSLSPDLLSNEFFAINFAHTPNSIYATRDFLDKYILNHLKNLKHVVISLDIDFWWKIDGDGGDNFFYKDVKRYPGYVYDEHHDYWKDGVPPGLLQATEKALGTEDAILYTYDRGRHTPSACGSWGTVPEIEIDSTYMDDGGYLKNSLEVLEDIIKKCEERNISVVGVIFPQSPAYAKSGAFGRYGLRRSVAKSLIEKIDGFSKTYTNFVLMDENKMGNHDYGNEMAVDFDHLCAEGIPQITERLNSILLGLEKRRDSK
ncbi:MULTISPECIES: TIGR02171 family protein [unclassified Fibrobacter]|uniref:TIGR02171 family lipoprotein n=1 Tax=unclassified Fibrobacter TaxID=2634177 RepID=UPI000D6D43A8|nr:MULTISPECIES: TIGR02171 family protein [unclassified Fibrobacter]PWJ71668.1 uncharacterized protein (TIGR02171 family) [Fibrobacter sp. UWR4]PZW74107.1 uncharacterized protein (TIGR02171 family) [Fibrobacter sp. UWR1]